MILTSDNVVSCFRDAMKRRKVGLPLPHEHAEPVTAMAIASLAQQTGISGSLWLSVNHMFMIEKLHGKVGRCAIAPYESLPHISVYAGTADPYRTLVTGTVQTSSDDEIGPDATSENNNYIWELSKLLQVWSPYRLFVALIEDENRGLLEQRIEEIVQCYHYLISPEHRVFSLVLSSSARDAQPARCHGWESHPSGMQPLPTATL